jgi:imidazolonepropionase
MSSATPTLITGIGQLVTLAPLAAERRATRVKDADLGIISGAWLALRDGRIERYGSGNPPAFSGYERRDVGGALVLPGLIDAHTHPIFAGSRANEFAMRANGATYQQIAAAGGGIRASMTATRGATDEELLELLLARLGRLARAGVTTVECKSGYGLSVSEELRLLRVLTKARARTAQTLSVTCLALHAASPEHASLKDYAKACAEELLPVVAKEKLADSVDAFVEAGYFSVDDTRPYAEAAKRLGLAVRLHADEFSDAGAAEAAAAWGAQSADHLQFASDRGVEAMAAKGVTAVILPGTSLYTKIPFTAARRFADAGCPVAIATDFNPGSCQIDDLAMLATVAAVQSGVRPAEAIAGVTFVAAHALGLAQRKGALAPGYDADLQVVGLRSSDEWLADFGRTKPLAVYVSGNELR